MSSKELRILDPAIKLLAQTDGYARIDIVEAAASLIGGWSLPNYRAAIQREREVEVQRSLTWGSRLIEAMRDVSWNPSLALSTIANPTTTSSQRKKEGVFHTDYRLAEHLASLLASNYSGENPIIDPAAGNGILLAAAVSAMSSDSTDAYELVSSKLCAADLSLESLNVLKAVIGSTVKSHRGPLAIENFSQRVIYGDSLISQPHTWKEIAPRGFGGIIGNPPWERLRTTIHEIHDSAAYGSEEARSISKNHESYADESQLIRAYTQKLRALGYTFTKGELDTYILFTELALRLLAENGTISFLIPAGIIRSHGTAGLRSRLVSELSDLRLTIHDNRPKYFEIDSRFKFLSMSGIRRFTSSSTISLSFGDSISALDPVITTEPIQIEASRVDSSVDPLIIPEVRTDSEWKLFRRLHQQHHQFQNDWAWEYRRELDMTNDRELFLGPTEDGIPLIEGRMVHQYRWRSKSYFSGSGRSADWQLSDMTDPNPHPQYRVNAENLPKKASSRINLIRAGFCDITGQTNERSMLASVIPPGVVCGNKVPTLVLEVRDVDPSDAPFLWVAVANSFVYDWLLRRTLTTTVNRFLLDQIPLPRLGAWVYPVIDYSKDLHKMEGSLSTSLVQIQRLRASIDHLVAHAYGILPRELGIILSDFPQLDKAFRSSADVEGTDTALTGDAILTSFGDTMAATRLQRANSAGWYGYVPNQFFASLQNSPTEALND